MPFFFFLEMLGPVIEVLGYGALLILILANKFSWVYALAILSLAFVMGFVVSLISIILSERNTRRFQTKASLLQLLGWALFENLGYRQLLSFWRFSGTFAAFSGKTHWGNIRRQRYQQETSAQKSQAQTM